MEKLPFLSPFNRSPIYFIPETTSTMDEAYRLRSEGAPSGTGIVTDFQTAGKGRLPGREWEASRGKNLLFTLILDNSVFKNKPTFIPLAVGLAVCKTLEKKTDLLPQIRWPNDVLVNTKKISGILCKSSGDTLYIGIGINLNQSQFDPALQSTATSVFIETNIHQNSDDFLKILLDNVLSSFSRENLLPHIEKRLWLLQKPCIYSDGDGGTQIKGVFSGLGANGELCIIPNHSKQIKKCISGTIRAV